MKTFSEVTNSGGNLTGDKYHIDDILNREIHLKGFEVKESKYKGECLIIQYDIYEQVKDKNRSFCSLTRTALRKWIGWSTSPLPVRRLL